MEKITAIELFSGSGKISRSLKELHISSTSFDNRKRKGVCEPDVRIDIQNLTRSKVLEFTKSNKIQVVFAGLPCTIWSNASGGFHLDKELNPKTELAVNHLKLTNHVLKLIKELNPDFYFIENPRGKLRYYKPMIDFLVKTNGMIKELTLSSYGFPTTKPTNVFTNMHQLNFKELAPFGRGAKAPGTFDNLTKVQRQTYPGLFVKEITDTIYKHYNSKSNA